MSQPPQTYELTTFSTLVVLCAAAVFFWLCIKMIFGFVQWVIDRNSSKGRVDKEEITVCEDDDVSEAEPDGGDMANTDEPPDLDTKKGK